MNFCTSLSVAFFPQRFAQRMKWCTYHKNLGHMSSWISISDHYPADPVFLSFRLESVRTPSAFRRLISISDIFAKLPAFPPTNSFTTNFVSAYVASSPWDPSSGTKSYRFLPNQHHTIPLIRQALKTENN
ncbi:hypothetical protein BYT27DRAFT_7255779 [Phlegmacium glaucopus]|nr:hypothetical protein BYT27DRAFT_7255779 [Phlegmacium glaucopus]